ncbi:MAG TPA: hypothetical protein VM597_28305 [Gemmataceae bacterium]|jgi:hypothetical protein|nr:hypothetical protein [Gemmataceae bacterium]
MKRAFLGVAAFALLLVTADSAKAQFGVSYSTRVGNSGFVTVGYGAPAYGYYAPTYGYYSPGVYQSSYVYPSTYYSAPAYYPAYTTGYYAQPSYGVYYNSGPRWGWGRRGWRW